MNETLKKIISSGKVVGGIGVFAARAYVNYKYPMAKPAWKRASKHTEIPYVGPFLDWFFKI